MLRARSHPLRRAVVALVFGVACSSPTAPVAPEGVFVLQSFGSHPLPAVTASSAGFREILLADTVHIAADGSGTRTRLLRWEAPDGSRPATEVLDRHALTVTARNGELHVAEAVNCLDEHATESCAALRNGRATVLGATLQIGIRTYARVADGQ